MPEAVLNVLVGEGTGQTLEEIEVEFPTPAVDIEVPDKQVEVTRCEVIPGKVIVVGRVIKSTCFLREKRDIFLLRMTRIVRMRSWARDMNRPRISQVTQKFFITSLPI